MDGGGGPDGEHALAVVPFLLPAWLVSSETIKQGLTIDQTLITPWAAQPRFPVGVLELCIHTHNAVFGPLG